MQCEILFDKIIHIDMKYNYVISYCEIIHLQFIPALLVSRKRLCFTFRKYQNEHISKFTKIGINTHQLYILYCFYIKKIRFHIVKEWSWDEVM